MPRSPIPAAFVALLLGLLAVICLAVPVPFGPRWEAGALVEFDSVETCFRLDDDRAPPSTEVPLRARLRPEAAPSGAAPPGWYVADLAESHRVPGEAMWRWISRDSIEIRWHHSPSIRLLANGSVVRGVAIPGGAAPPFFALLERRRIVVGASSPCGGIAAPPHNDR